MAEHEEAPFSFTAFAGLDIVSDNARSHAPFETLSESDSSSSSDEDDDDDEGVPPHQPLSPARGLTRWGSQEDLVCSSTPKPPSRTSSDTDSPVNLAAAIPIVTEIEANASIGLQIPDDPGTCMWQPPTSNNTGNSSLLETRIHRIRSRWNSHVTDENNKAITGKVKLSPTLPKRCKDCLEEMKMPALPDIQRTVAPHQRNTEHHHHHDPKDCISSILSQSEGTLWKGIIRQQQNHAGDPFFPSIVSPSSSSDDRDDGHDPSAAALESMLDPDP